MESHTESCSASASTITIIVIVIVIIIVINYAVTLCIFSVFFFGGGSFERFNLFIFIGVFL